MLDAPQQLDGIYDSAGECWVSLRRRAAVRDRTREELVADLGDEKGWIDESLQRFVDQDLIAALDGRYLALALPVNPHL